VAATKPPPLAWVRSLAEAHTEASRAVSDLAASYLALVEAARPLRERIAGWEHNTDRARVAVRLGDLRRLAALLPPEG